MSDIKSDKIKNETELELIVDPEIHENQNFKKLFNVILFLKITINLIIPLLLSIHTRKGFFQPDEYYQTLNVAYNKALGISSSENTWEWSNNLRSYLFPFIIEVFGYRLFGHLIPTAVSIYLSYVKDLLIIFNQTAFHQNHFLIECSQYIGVLNIEVYEKLTQYGIEYGPIVVMCFIGAITDYFTIALIYKISMIINKETGITKLTKSKANQIIKVSFLIVTTNFFNTFFQTRFFINSFEMFLNTAALYFFDWNNESKNDFVLSLTLGFISILQRPTNGFVWIILGSYRLFNHNNTKSRNFAKLFKQLIVSLFAALSITILTDFYFYNEITFPFVTFVKFNFSKNLSKFYGSAPMNFHIFQSIPILNGITLPYYILSFLNFTKSHKIIKWLHILLIFNLILFSLIDHKEFRFLFPVQQTYLLLSTLQYLKNPIIPSSIGQIICYGSLIIGWILAYFNETGVIELCNYLKNSDIRSVSLLMPCHSTPGTSYINKFNGNIWQLSCEPPLHLLDETDKNKLSTELSSYLDESDIFYLDYSQWIEQNVGTHKLYQWPECIAMFSNLSNELYYTDLKPNGYVLEKKWFNSLKHWDHRRDGDVELYCKN
ncbi:hypothetical protein ACO0SA_001327 [Hanseniaspora valbyensis]